MVEASYIGNRGVWWALGGNATPATGPLGYLNQVSPAAFASVGLNPYANPADNLLLTSALSNPSVIARVGNYLPYSGYSTSNTLINALRPFPQFSNILVTNSPTGNTYYDSLQVRGTKRLSHGLQINSSFTWSKAMDATREDIFSSVKSKSIQSTDQPVLFIISGLYQTQKWFGNRVLSTVTKDWQISGTAQYGSGLPLAPPNSTVANNLGASEMLRVPGQPLFLKDLNCGCINPYTDQVLNPKAWANPTPGTFGPGAVTKTTGQNGLYYTDFRQARRPSENLAIGRNFRVKERMNFQIRAEFANIFNRTQIGNPLTGATSPFSATNAYLPPTVVNGRITGGFGGYQVGWNRRQPRFRPSRLTARSATSMRNRARGR